MYQMIYDHNDIQERTRKTRKEGINKVKAGVLINCFQNITYF